MGKTRASRTAAQNSAQAATTSRGAAIGGALTVGAAAGYLGMNALLQNRRSDSSSIMSSLVYPYDLNSEYMSFTFQDYSFTTSTPGSFGGSGIKITPANHIVLPIPNNLRDTTAVTYDQTSMMSAITSLTGTALDSAKKILGGKASEYISGATGAMESLKPAAALGLAMISGEAINPFLTVLFKQPNFKSHTFSWKLIPNDARDSQRIMQIVKTFKAKMLPGKGPNLFTFKYPSLVQVNLSNGSKMYNFKPAVIQGFDVNFAGAGTPAFHNDRTPAAVEISIRLQEIEFWMSEDYSDPRVAAAAPLPPPVPTLEPPAQAPQPSLRDMSQAGTGGFQRNVNIVDRGFVNRGFTPPR